MKKLLLSLFTLCLLFTVCKSQEAKQSSDWKEFVSTEGNFKALFPKIPVSSIKELDNPNGKLKSYRFDVNLPDVYFTVMYADYPNISQMNENQLKANYAFVRDGTLKQTNATLISEKDIWLNDNLGVELMLKLENTIIRYKYFLVGNRVFQPMTSFNSSLLEDANTQQQVNKFLGSFQIIEK